MKNPFYVIEAFYGTGGMDYPEWHKKTTHKTLKADYERWGRLSKLAKIEPQ